MTGATVHYLFAPMVPADKTPNRIRELRRAKGMTIQAVADEIGMSKPYLSAIERGERSLKDHQARLIARVLEASPADLLSAADNPDALADDERRMVQVYRALDAKGRHTVRSLGEQLMEWTTPEQEDEDRKRA